MHGRTILNEANFARGVTFAQKSHFFTKGHFFMRVKQINKIKFIYIYILISKQKRSRINKYPTEGKG